MDFRRFSFMISLSENVAKVIIHFTNATSKKRNYGMFSVFVFVCVSVAMCKYHDPCVNHNLCALVFQECCHTRQK